jgi:uncharacterized RDD family membrane protein YckC
MRFDEIELQAVPIMEDPDAAIVEESPGSAHLARRLFALLTDLSLFAALALALSPLLPQPYAWTHISGLAGFVLIVSYYYFVGSWMLWGKTIGATIFDVRVVPLSHAAISLRDASMRWVAVCLSLLTAGLGFALALLPSRLSLPDRLSNTRSV